MILAGDVGGTKVALGLVERDGEALRVRREARYETADHDGLAAVVRAFLEEVGARPDVAAFGVAAPVVDGTAAMTNVDWTLEAEALARAIGVERVALLNDVAAAALGADALGPAARTVLHAGRPRETTVAIVAPGTGLGMAVLAERGGRPLVLPGEGGHQAFAPRSELDADLLAFLRARYDGHVSAERVVSGPGIHAIYEFLVASGREEEPAWLAERIASSGSPSEAISRAALAGEASICAATMDVFAGCLGAVCGDLALSVLALRGVWLGGGIAPDILPLLREGPFLEAVRGKGRLRDLLADVPVAVVLDPAATLVGAARWATLAEG